MQTHYQIYVLVHSSAITKIPYPEWFIKNRSFVLTALDSGKFKVKSPADSMSW